MAHRIPLLALSLLVVLALCACGGSTKTVVTVSGSASTSQPASPSATATATSVTSSRTVQPRGPAPCRAAGLALSFLGGQGATGHGELGFALRNIGAKSCSTIGFPGDLFLARSGAALPTASKRTTHDFFGSTPVAALVIEPRASVSFRLGVTHGINSSAGCTTAYGLQVIPPNDTATLRISIPHGGAYECRTVTVSPLRPNNSAYP